MKTFKIEPSDHPDFVGGNVWRRDEIEWIRKKVKSAYETGYRDGERDSRSDGLSWNEATE